MKIRNFSSSRFFQRSFGLVFLFFLPASILNASPQYYDFTVTNNFGSDAYYGTTPADSDIWILSNFKFDYQSGGSFVTGNNTAGAYGTAVRLSDIQGGKMRLYSADGGTRMHAVLSQGAIAPTTSDLDTKPNNYFEWSFDSGNPGTLDLSWIDSFDFLSRMTVDAKGNQTPAPNKVTFGAGASVSTKVLGDRLQTYVDRPGGNYSWLGTGSGGFSQSLTYSGATNVVRWSTNNSGAAKDTSGSTIPVNAPSIGSFTKAIDKVESTAASSSNTWSNGTPATGPNWTNKGFRVAGLQGMDPLDGSNLGANDESRMWSAYVTFSESGGQYTMTLTDFTIYGLKGGNAPASGQYEQLWNAGSIEYSVTEAQGMLNALWTSSNNFLDTVPKWVGDMGANVDNMWYAIYNAIASGAIYDSDFVNDTALPTSVTGNGYVPYVNGQNTYNFEILTRGAAVTGGLAEFLTGDDLVSLMNGEDASGDLVNPYFLELLKLMQQTPAYLYPSQDFWGAISVGTDTFIGLQPGPLNGDAVFGDAVFEWELGSGAPVPEPSAFGLVASLLAAGVALRRRPR